MSLQLIESMVLTVHIGNHGKVVPTSHGYVADVPFGQNMSVQIARTQTCA